MGGDFLQIADALVKNRDIKSLQTLQQIIGNLILKGVIDKEKSLTEIGEYIDEAISQIKVGNDTQQIMSSSIRQLLE